jgi:hypothetical protein
MTGTMLNEDRAARPAIKRKGWSWVPPVNAASDDSLPWRTSLPSPTADRRKWRPNRSLDAVVIAIYLAIGLAAFWPELPRISTSAFSTTGDFYEAVWFLAWVPHALAHGLNPFFSYDLNAPTGTNLAENAASPLLGLIGAPVTALTGPLVTANLLLVLGMPLSAAAAYLVLRAWRVWRPAAAVGGLFYGFSAFMVGHALGHVLFVMAPLPPLIVWSLSRLLSGTTRQWRTGVFLGLLVAGQFLISQEIFAIVVAACALGLVVAAALRPGFVRVAVRRSGPGLILAIGVTGVLLAYPLWMMLAGPQHFTGTTFSESNPYHADVLSSIVPGPMQHLKFGGSSLAQRVLGGDDPSEDGAYLGIPLLLAVVFFTWRGRRSPRTQIAAIVLVVAEIMSLGPRLTVDGHATTIPLPFAIVARIPLLDNILPIRISFVSAALAAAIVAFGLDDYNQRRLGSHQSRSDWRLGAVISCLVVVIAVAVFQWPTWPYTTSPAGQLPSEVLNVLRGGDPRAQVYPYDTGMVLPMLWQARAGFPFALLDGYAWHPDAEGRSSTVPNRMHPGALQRFLSAVHGKPLYGPLPAIDTELVRSTRVTVAQYRIQLLIVDLEYPGSAPVVHLFTRAFGPPTRPDRKFDVWYR